MPEKKYEMSQEPLHKFVPNSNGRRVCSLAWTSLKVTSNKKTAFSGGLRAVYI